MAKKYAEKCFIPDEHSNHLHEEDEYPLDEWLHPGFSCYHEFGKHRLTLCQWSRFLDFWSEIGVQVFNALFALPRLAGMPQAD